MSKNLVTILLLTLVTIAAWVAFQIFKEGTKSTITTQAQHLQELNPNLDKSVLEDLKKAPK
jgi:peptidoglycan hydrolase CwlO-like protein